MKKIIHIDMDCFYAAVEIRDNPTLKGKPVGIGSPNAKRGVLCTANYEARKFGVRAALPTAMALKLCKDLILVKPHFEKYKKESLIIREIFKEFTEKIEPLSLDEAYLDVSECEEFSGSATLIAQEIRKRIFERTGLTASAGVAPNKFLAKVASDWNKPNGQYVVTPESIDSFVKDLPVKKIFGVGKVSAKKLHGYGINTCEDLQKYSLIELRNMMGNFGNALYKYCRGIDEREVETSRERKSLSVETTFSKDLESLEDVLAYTNSIFEELKFRIDNKEISLEEIKTLIVKVKFFDFKQTTVSSSDISFSLKSFKSLLTQGYERAEKPVRLIGFGVAFHQAREVKLKGQLVFPIDPFLLA